MHLYSKYEMYEQLSIFDLFGDKKKVFKIPKDVEISLIECFGGIGSQAMALKTLGVNFKTQLIEFDKYACKTYNAIHGTNFEPTDIRDVHGKDLQIREDDKHKTILCYSFPCTDLSVAGKMQGMSKGSGTRSGLLWEVERLLTELHVGYLDKPSILLMENVSQVHGKRNEEDWKSWLQFLESMNYTNFWMDMNAKNFGVAQSRNRTIMISILGDYDYKFPAEIPLDKCMADYLEDHVDEKYYLKSEKAQKLIDKLIASGQLVDRQTDRQTDRQLTYASRVQNGLASQTASRQESMQESVTYSQMATECARYTANMNEDHIKEFDSKVAAPLCARDYKGFGTGWSTGNGVIEGWK